MTASAVVDFQLVFVRSLFDRARLAAGELSDLGNMQALLTADIAVETLGKIALERVPLPHGQQRRREANAQDIVAALEQAYPSLGGRPEMQTATRLRQARNPVQHQGHVPSPSEVSRHLADVESYMRLVVCEAYGISFDEVSSISLVRTEWLRDALEQGRQHVLSGRLDIGVACVAAVFEVMLDRASSWVRMALGHHPNMEGFLGISANEVVLYVFGADFPDWFTTQRNASSADGQFALMSLGFSVPELARLQEIRRIALAILKAWKAAVSGNETPGEKPIDEKILQGPDSPLRCSDGTMVAATDVLQLFEVEALRLWHLEAEHPELVSTKHPASLATRSP
ncbi:MAG: hypothetical protein JST54_28880 [Deltaproteobacteria bacterium]|nr:hypothetical protein [Deltaproteobacteria bacterium]